jgi:hypothetical protein
VSISDWLVIAPWLAFGLGLIIFYIWLRRPAKPPSRRGRKHPMVISQAGPPPDERSRPTQSTESDHHEQTTS